jgi:beta-glucanase (GH16 family)
MAEDFCTPLNLDTDPIWTWSDGAPADGDTWFRKEQISFANGNMSITAIPMNLPANYTSYSESDYNSATGKPTGRHFVSGELRTKYNNYRYGRYEVRFKSPTANSNPALGGYISDMFAFRTPKWQTWNEVDVELEPMDGTTSIIRQVSGNVVYLQNPGAGVPGYPGGAAFDAMPTGVANYIQTETHTYAFEWTSTTVTWYLDGNVIHSYSYPASGGNPPNAGGNFPHIPNMSSKIMMNLWVFAGTHFGDPSANMYPLTSVYEYFRFYKQNGETYPCTNTPSCLSAADTAFAKNNVNETVYP